MTVDGTTSPLSAEARNFNWLLGKFAHETPGVIEAVAVSSDGLLMAVSTAVDMPRAARLAAIVSGLTSLAGGAARTYDLGMLNKVIIDMSDGYLLVTAISSGSVLGVVAAKSANLGNVAYEMTLFTNRVGVALSPQLIAELKSSVG
ncbi:roadblock/LC7 domain-containing protein [Actinokineospora sp.]|uniref:roadblock/LC7 domain-containing protein n=1 Tax=Actinokineospora sp. TaxID=1872133 RepID=UPI004037ED65